MRACVFRLSVFFGLIAIIGSLPTHASGFDARQRWVTTWTTSNAAIEHPASFSNQTIREVVHVTVGGSMIRLRLSNTFGPRSIQLDTVFVGLQKDGSSLVQGSNHEVTFGGSRAIAIPEGADVLSDPVPLVVEPEKNLTISLFTAGETGPATVHAFALQTNYISGAGNFAAEEGGNAFVNNGASGSTTMDSWYFLSAVEVLASTDAKGAAVALGDSITDGAAAPSRRE